MRLAIISFKKKLFTIAALYLTLSCPVTIADTLTYQTTMGKDTVSTIYTISQVETGIKVVAEYNPKGVKCFSSVTMTDLLVTRNWTYKSIQDRTNLSAMFQNDSVILKGSYRNRKINKKFFLNTQIWKQMFPFDLKDFIISDSSETSFCGISTIEIAPMQLGTLVVKKIGLEHLQINGKDMELMHVRVAPPGVISVFWHGDYWYKKSCGTMVKSISYDFPGAQAVVSVLLN